eukprot:53660_1
MPLDICMKLGDDYIMYKCDIEDALSHTLIKLNFTHNSNCLDNTNNNTIVTNFTQTLTINATTTSTAELYSFNCIGDDNYIIDTIYPNEQYCHENNTNNTDDYYLKYSVTDICFTNQIGSGYYYKYICNGYYMQFTQYTSSDCRDTNSWFSTKTTLLSTTNNKCNSWVWASVNDLEEQSDIRYKFTHCIHNDNILLPTDTQQIDALQIKALVDLYMDCFSDALVTFSCLYNSWDLSQIINGNLYASNGYSDLCGLHVSMDNDTINSNNTTNITKTIIYSLDFDSIGLTCSLPETICNLKDLTEIKIISEPGIYGTLPSCIGTDLIHLETLYLWSEPNTNPIQIEGIIPSEIGNLPNFRDLFLWNIPKLTGIIPESLCNIKSVNGLYGFSELWIYDVPLIGTIPNCLFHNFNYSQTVNLSDPKYVYFALENTNIEGTIPNSLCNVNEYIWFQISNNPKLYGDLPQCLGNVYYWIFHLSAMNNITGRIPIKPILCDYNHYLRTVVITANPLLSPQQLPSCFGDQILHNMNTFIISDSNFMGIMPAIPYSTDGWVDIFLDNNNLEGTLSDILKIFYDSPNRLSNLEVLTLHNNNFYEKDISLFLKILFEHANAGNLAMFTISNNKNIHGYIPDLKTNTLIKYSNSGSTFVTGFFAQNCDLRGTLPTNVKFTGLDFLVLSGNRISGVLPDNFKNIGITRTALLKQASQADFSSFILLNNLFMTNENELPLWITSPIQYAPNLYISKSERDTKWFIVIMSFLGIILSFYLLICRKIKKK